MHYETQLYFFTVVGAIALAAIYLYLKDLRYSKRTGRPASERVRERTERLARPLTRGKYIAILTFEFSFFAAWVLLLIYGSTGWRRCVPLGFMVVTAMQIYAVTKRQHKEQFTATRTSGEVSGDRPTTV